MMREVIVKRGGGDRGSALVEFVLVFPIVMVMLFGIVEFGILLNAQLVLDSTARDAARRSAVEGGATERVYELIESQLLTGGIEPEEVEVYISPWTAPYGHSIRVRLTYEYPLMVPAIRAIVGRSVSLKSEVITRSEKL